MNTGMVSNDPRSAAQRGESDMKIATYETGFADMGRISKENRCNGIELFEDDGSEDGGKRWAILSNDLPELLSVSLGSAETTLVKLTNAYCTFVNGGKKVTPIFIDRIQDRRGKTIFNSDKRQCNGCKEISYLKSEVPTINDDRKQIISQETAYQLTSMMEGVIKRGTGRKLKSLNLYLAGKTGTTNKNMDAWFLGFTSKIAIGVYVGFDEPKSLGKYETGAKAALPIFKTFVKKVVKKKDSYPFKIPNTINLVMIDPETGQSPNKNTKKIIYESFKPEDNFATELEKTFNKDKLGLGDSEQNGKILRFY